MIGVYPTLIIG